MKPIDDLKESIVTQGLKFRPRHLALLIALAFPCGSLIGAEEATATAGVILGEYKVAQTAGDAVFLDQLVSQGLPAGYGEILGALVDSAKDASTKAAASGSGDAAKLASQYALRDSLKRILDAVGDLATLLDVGGKVYTEEYTEAAISSTLAILGKFAGANDAAAMKAIGLTGTAVFTTAVVAVQIWWASEKEKRAQTRSAQVEAFYGQVEGMLRSGKRGKDPFPPTPDNVEKLWQRILSDQNFRAVFKVYVSDILGRDYFPESSWFDRLGAKAAYVGSAFNLDADKLIEKNDQKMMLADENVLKSHVASLLVMLNEEGNRAYLAAEARKALEAVRAELNRLGASQQVVQERIVSAIAMLEVVEVYLKRAPAAIDKAIAAKDFDALEVERRGIVGYTKDVIAWVPRIDEVGRRRDQYYASLKKLYSRTTSAQAEILGELRKKIEQPKIEAPLEEGATPEPVSENIDAARYYETEFRPLFKPFDWGGLESLAPVREKYVELLERGQFEFFRGEKLPAGRQALAEMVEQAILNEDYQGALRLEPGTPKPEEKIKGYYFDLANKIASKPIPATMRSLQDAINAISLRVAELKKRRWDVAGSDEERIRERARIDAQIAAAEAELNPLQKQHASWFEARTAALALLKSAIDAQRSMDQLELERTREWMSTARGRYAAMFDEARRAKELFESGMRLKIEPELSPDKLSTLLRMSVPGATAGLLAVGKISDPEQYDAESVAGALNKNGSTLRSTSGRHAVAYEEHISHLRHVCSRALYESERIINQFEAVKPHLADIIRMVDPQFKLDESPLSNARRQKPIAESLCRKADALEDEAQNERADGLRLEGQLRGMALAWEDWLQIAVQKHEVLTPLLLSAGGAVGDRGRLVVNPHAFTETTYEGKTYLLRAKPYPHLLTQSERDSIVADLSSQWQQSGLQKFSQMHAPWLAKVAEPFMAHWQKQAVFVENKWTYAPDRPITFASLEQAAQLIGQLRPGAEDFLQKTAEIGVHLGHFFADESVSPLYPQWRKLSDQLKALAVEHQKMLETHARAEKERTEASGLISDEQAQQVYQQFVDAYSRGDVRGILQLLAPNWRGGDGADSRDVENYLNNSFKVFTRIQYRISGFTAQKRGDGTMQVSYSVVITGENSRRRLKPHREERRITENVGLIQGQPRILQTISGSQWLRAK